MFVRIQDSFLLNVMTTLYKRGIIKGKNEQKKNDNLNYDNERRRKNTMGINYL
ncbi:hypothetical protein CPAST_c23950 [Clostridium pasteurianum DSM 525 = ATCC 6013]|uniref:Uncharacterized protein n=1 Tax=Clostridium pasteurianum DSM 525 = ATCC 6013 TaxID=1262449 RepID=A0A0H3JAD4_CLOPA|nr:hypothetical protein CPAST_c23950 [Clostridium pasteurianum DSM 525 = ATCC 6013]AJA52453.1 hypothetical protein CLPA_c23950 [Clostridium pasteurianum DSM 525 = ATCC 6013]KRU11537.1 hypothetical protein CP6013_00784 [Clostridium pasteurianum DSM 525 = ATCC 6013]